MFWELMQLEEDANRTKLANENISQRALHPGPGQHLCKSRSLLNTNSHRKHGDSYATGLAFQQEQAQQVQWGRAVQWQRHTSTKGNQDSNTLLKEHHHNISQLRYIYTYNHHSPASGKDLEHLISQDGRVSHTIFGAKMPGFQSWEHFYISFTKMPHW